MKGKIGPLGVDIGFARARIAVVEKTPDATLRVRAVASRDVPDAQPSGERTHLMAALLEEMLAELGVRERRCIVGLGAADASLHMVRFPKMSWAERLRAARFEAQRFSGVDLSSGEYKVRVHPFRQESGAYGVGVVRGNAVAELTSILKCARLRPIAVDYNGCALRRVLGEADAIVDVGAQRSTVYAYANDGVVTVTIDGGGEAITRGISGELSIDDRSAERRKRILGCAGAGAAARKSLALEIGASISRLRERTSIRRVALVGNGARLPGLATELENILTATVEIPVPRLLESDAYPEDVVRAAAPDWTLAAALATWSHVDAV